MTKTYKPKDVLLTHGGVDITGFMDSGKVSTRRNTMNTVSKTEKLSRMFALQAKVNAEAFDGENWYKQNRPWYRAAWMEAAELLEHFGYKWWKMQEPDMVQAQMELVDIWHFAMSQYLEYVLLNGGGIKKVFSPIMCESMVPKIEATYKPNPFELTERLEVFVGRCVRDHDISFEKLAPLFSALNMDVDKLYKMYVGKNALNRFRQGHGYQEGTYAKLWGGKEDNVWLAEILEELDGDNPDFYDNLLCELAKVYENTQARKQERVIGICKGRNCNAIDGVDHSDECIKDHDDIYRKIADPLDTPGNRNPRARYAGYTGKPMGKIQTDDEKAAYQEGVNAREPGRGVDHGKL